MPRGGEFTDGPTVASDNAIDAGENKIAGAPQGDSDVSLAPAFLCSTTIPCLIITLPF